MTTTLDRTTRLEQSWPARVLRTLIAWSWMILYWLFWITLHILTLKKAPVRFQMQVIRFWGKSMFWVLGIQCEVEGLHHLETRESRVVVCNHQSALDVIWGAVICPPAPLTIGKKEVIYVPILNLLWWAFDFIRIDRSRSAQSVATLNTTVEVIQKGKRSLVIAPEGTRSPDGKILPFKKGAFHVAYQSQVPIVPVAVQGAFERMTKNEWIARPGKIHIRVLPPMAPPAPESDPEKAQQQVRTWTEQVRTRIVEEYEKLTTLEQPVSPQ